MVKTMRCPYCGASFEVPETVSVAVCPYCGTTVWTATGEEYKEHYMYDAKLGFNQAYKNALGIAVRQFAVPEDLEEEASPQGGLLHFIPLYLYHILIRASCPGNPEAGLEDKWINTLATSNPPRGLPVSYRFPTRGRRYFEPAKLERGRYHQPDLDPKTLLERISTRYYLRAVEEALDECDDPRVENKSEWSGIVHYPFWQITYSYAGKPYEALVDAADGTVVYLEYPISMKKRGILAAGTIAAVIAGIAGGVAASLALIHSPQPGLTGIVAGLPPAYRFLRLGAARIGRYRVIRHA